MQARIPVAQPLDQLEALGGKPAGVDAEHAHLACRSRRPCRSARRRRSGTRSRSRCSARSARAPTRARSPAPRPRTRSKARRLPARRSAPLPSRSCLLSYPGARRLRPASAPSSSSSRRRVNVGEGLAVEPAVEPAGDQALDGGVELVGRHAPEERPADRGAGAEPAADEDVVRLPAHTALVARGRSLEAEVGDPVLRARVRAAVELEPEVGDVGAEPLARGSRSARRAASSSRRRRSCSAARRCRRSSCRAGCSPRAAKPISASSADGRVELRRGNVRDHEVLLARHAHVAADPFGEVGDRDHLVAGDEAEMHRDADRVQALPASARGRRGGSRAGRGSAAA